jgi:hypothetical protein
MFCRGSESNSTSNDNQQRLKNFLSQPSLKDSCVAPKADWAQIDQISFYAKNVLKQDDFNINASLRMASIFRAFCYCKQAASRQYVRTKIRDYLKSRVIVLVTKKVQ